LKAKETDERIKPMFQWALDGVNAELHPVTITEETLRSYAGDYGPRKISFEDGSLFYQRGNGPKARMMPMGEDYFRFAEMPSFRLKIVKKDGRISGVEGHYDDGTIDADPRTN
jgi:hypothetical protein